MYDIEEEKTYAQLVPPDRDDARAVSSGRRSCAGGRGLDGRLGGSYHYKYLPLVKDRQFDLIAI